MIFHLDEYVQGLRDVEGYDLELLVYLFSNRKHQNRIFFVGNGGSAAIASHMTIDFMKNGGYAAMCFNDGAALTCLGNDLGFENVFSRQLQLHGRRGDLLVAISSSGNSPDILKAAEVANTFGIYVITLTGFEPNNKLRDLGDYNIWVPSLKYGVVEMTHHTLLHKVLDTLIERNM